MVNIYDSINQASADTRETDQFKALQTAFEAVKADATASATFKRFQAAQGEINATMQAGQEPNEEQVKTWQSIAGEMEGIEVLKNLMAAEQAMNNLLMEINDIITKPISELYATPM
jgi:cell fate (sporulation/competence/biofilm development) regulator YlbF (YheA/YmcA/DUF963 family)